MQLQSPALVQSNVTTGALESPYWEPCMSHGHLFSSFANTKQAACTRLRAQVLLEDMQPHLWVWRSQTTSATCWVACFFFSVAPKQEILIHNQLCFLNIQTDIPKV